MLLRWFNTCSQNGPRTRLPSAGNGLSELVLDRDIEVPGPDNRDRRTVDLTIFPASRENTGNFAYFACWEQQKGAEYCNDNNVLRENSRRPRTWKFRVPLGN